MIIVSALIVAAAVAWGARLVAVALAAARQDARQTRSLTILGPFAPALDAARPAAVAPAAPRGDAGQTRPLTILGLFTPALDAAQRDPRALLVWQPLAR